MSQRLKTIKKKSFFGRLSVYLAQNIENDVIRSGKPENLILFVKRYVKLAIICGVIVYPLIVVLFLAAQAELDFIEKETPRIQELNRELRNQARSDPNSSFGPEQSIPFPTPFISTMSIPTSIALGITPPILLAYPKLLHKNLAKNRKKSVEEELPFFSIFASVMQSVNKDLYTSFTAVIDKDIFGGLEKEALLMKRNVELFGRSPLEALEEIGRSHESQIFKDFLLGYSSIARSGGDLSKYLETGAKEHFANLKLKYQSYARNVGYVVETVVIILVIVPMLFVVSAFVVPSESINQILILSGVVLPVITIMFSIVLVNIQPKMYNIVGVNDHTALMFLPISMMIFLVGLVFGIETWLALAIAAIIPSLALEYLMIRHRKQISSMEKSLPDFLRDITEYRKIGIQDTAAVIKISETNSYNKQFDRLLNLLARSYRQGYTPTEVMGMITIRSWFSRISFFILSQITVTGGGSPEILENITTFVRNLRNLLKDARSQIAIYDALGYMAPLLLVFTVVTITELVTTIHVPDSYSQTVGFNFQAFQELTQKSSIFINAIKTFIITSAISIGLLLGKSLDSTFKSTGRIAYLCILSVIAILVTEHVSVLKVIGF